MLPPDQPPSAAQERTSIVAFSPLRMRPRFLSPSRLVVVSLSAASVVACAKNGRGAAASDTPLVASAGTVATESASPNVLTPAEQAAGWRLLFDGTTTKGWRGYKTPTMPNGWRVENGTLTKDGSVGDLVSADPFANFELALDWKIAGGGNAGIFYRGTEEYDHIYWSAPEYQLLDDANAPDGKDRLTSAAAAYALYPSPAGIVKPAGEWNSTRILVNGAHVEHWLNGQKVVQYELWSPDWEAKVKASKFKDWPNYGRAKSGYLAIQGDHDGALTLRNIKIRTLP
jgi:3-keto-disaccharide hydrolase